MISLSVAPWNDVVSRNSRQAPRNGILGTLDMLAKVHGGKKKTIFCSTPLQHVTRETAHNQ